MDDGGWWLGKVTEPRPEEPIGPPTSKDPRLHVWNTDKDGNPVEKAKKAKKTSTKKKSTKKASEEMTLDELRALLAQKQQEEEKEEKDKDDDEDESVESVIVDGVEYQLNREDNIVLDPEDMEIMGTWNAEEGKIDFEDEEAEKKHQERV